MDWKWKGKIIKEVKKLKYLGYTLQRNGEHVKDSKGGDNDETGIEDREKKIRQ